MIQLFIKGGPVMWPLLATSIVAVAVVVERLNFIFRERKLRTVADVETVLSKAESGDFTGAISASETSTDFVARVLGYGLSHREPSFSNALLLAANRELKRFSQGLSILDTIITLAPLLGLFGTVTGMIHAFGLLGNQGLDAPSVITGGISEALIATAFGLIIAILALIPFNYLNDRLEAAKHEIEDAATYLELLLVKLGSRS